MKNIYLQNSINGFKRNEVKLNNISKRPEKLFYNLALYGNCRNFRGSRYMYNQVNKAVKIYNIMEIVLHK